MNEWIYFPSWSEETFMKIELGKGGHFCTYHPSKARKGGHRTREKAWMIQRWALSLLTVFWSSCLMCLEGNSLEFGGFDEAFSTLMMQIESYYLHSCHVSWNWGQGVKCEFSIQLPSPWCLLWPPLKIASCCFDPTLFVPIPALFFLCSTYHFNLLFVSLYQ